MPNEDPLPNMTAQERKDWEQLKATNRGAAELAANAGHSAVRNLIDKKQRDDRDGGRERERTR